MLTASEADPAERLIIALDHPDLPAALRQVEQLDGLCRWYKIGLQLFTAAGPAAVAAVRERGGRVFLDLKLHDIPETAARAVAAAGALGVELVTVHAAGGREMVRRASAVGRAVGVKVLAVTVLTSLSAGDLDEVGVSSGDLPALVLKRARLSEEAGADGVVASPREAALLRRGLPRSFLVVTPGVRPAESVAASADLADDQKRTGSAWQAVIDGVDRLVVGRPVRDAADPRAAASTLLDEIRVALSERGARP